MAGVGDVVDFVVVVGFMVVDGVRLGDVVDFVVVVGFVVVDGVRVGDGISCCCSRFCGS